MAYEDPIRGFKDILNNLKLDPSEYAAPEPNPKPALKFDLRGWDTLEAFTGEAPEQKWLIGGIMPLGSAGLLAAAGGTGKSYTALELCLQVTRGHVPGLRIETPILGGEVKSHGAAVFITAEDDRGSVHRRLRALDSTGRRQEMRQYPLYIVPLPDAGGTFPLFAEERNKVVATPQFWALREQLLAIPDLALVILDPLQCFAHCNINADPMHGAAVMSTLATLAAETGATVLATHHVRKERTAPANLEEARQLIRGSTTLVDQGRFAIMMWTPQPADAKKVCEKLGAEYKPNAVVYGGLTKENSGGCRDQWTALRGPNGLLRDVTADLIKKHVPKSELADDLVEAIASAAEAGSPYTKTAGNGLFKRRSELGEALAVQSRARLESMADDLLLAGKIVQARHTGATVQWLDVPTGPFARGKGELAPGAHSSHAGRRSF